MQVAAASFLAPEHDMANAPPAVGEKADSWALGVLLFTLLTGELPFTLSTEVKAKHVERIRARACQVRLFLLLRRRHWCPSHCTTFAKQGMTPGLDSTLPG